MDMQMGLIYSKIPAIMAAVGVIGKDNTNKMQGYKFRGIDDMYNALNQHLSAEKVFITSEVLNVQREEKTSKSGGALIYSIITMRFRYFAEDGSSVESTTVGEAMDSGDKSMNKAMSTAYKYSLMQIFCIPTEEPKDSENDTYEVQRATAPVKTQASTPTAPKTPQPATLETREFNGTTYTRRSGVSKAGKAYDGWFPLDKTKQTYWSNSSFAQAVNAATGDNTLDDLPY